MILFIHGFGSCGLGDKSRVLIEHYGRQQVLAPDLFHGPAKTIAELESLLQQYQVELLVGSSLGGYYATWLNGQHGSPSVLINPALSPWKLPGVQPGHHTRWCNGEPFELKQVHLDQLQDYHRPVLSSEERYLVLLQTGDEVLDYRQAAEYYRDKEVVEIAGGSHRFDQFELQLPRIDGWLRGNRP